MKASAPLTSPGHHPVRRDSPPQTAQTPRCAEPRLTKSRTSSGKSGCCCSASAKLFKGPMHTTLTSPGKPRSSRRSGAERRKAPPPAPSTGKLTTQVTAADVVDELGGFQRMEISIVLIALAVLRTSSGQSTLSGGGSQDQVRFGGTSGPHCKKTAVQNKPNTLCESANLVFG